MNDVLAGKRHSGFSYATEQMFVLFYPARAPKPFNIDVIHELNRIFVDVKSDEDGQVHEGGGSVHVTNAKSGPPLTAPQEKLGDRTETLVQFSIPKGTEKTAFREIAAVAKKFGLKAEMSEASHKPSVRKKTATEEEGLTMTMPKFASQNANELLTSLDKAAGAIQENYASWGMPFEVARDLTNTLDKTADAIETATYGDESFKSRQAKEVMSRVGKVIQQDPDEKYMTTFNAPTKLIQSDADEKYMSAYSDDDTHGVATGKSTTGRPLCP